MKKLLALLLALCLPCAALGEGMITANGVVESQHVYQIAAPFSGVIKPFDWEMGDSVTVGNVLFEMDTIKVYAAADGVVTAVFAQPGDLCSDVMGMYGMLASIEKASSQIVQASTAGAHNDEENRTIHMGEMVWMKQSDDKSNKATGRVVAVNGSQYVVEVIDGEIENGEDVKIYREEKMGSKSNIGSGRMAKSQDVAVAGSGRVIACHVSEGDVVFKGQLLFEMAGQDAEAGVISAQLTAPATGALELAVTSGQQVYKGQVLARVHDLSAMNVVAAVDEMDLDLVAVGDSLTVLLDRYPGVQFNGTVTYIARIGVPRQNATYYDVTIAITSSREVLPGMNATVQLSQGN